MTLGLVAAFLAIPACVSPQEPPPQPCRVEPVNFEGWQAQQISNRWVKFVIVPQVGGRVMRVCFDQTIDFPKNSTEVPLPLKNASGKDLCGLPTAKIVPWEKNP